MTNQQLYTSSKPINHLLTELSEDLNLKVTETGIFIDIISHETDSIIIAKKDEHFEIMASSEPKVLFAVAQLIKHQFNINQLTFDFAFESNGMMIDCSRNGVPNLDYIQSIIRKLAIMGHNRLLLYIEDVYEIPDEPYFGLMRGRYSKQELKTIDAYAKQFGIEVIPCIQTLAHLNQFLLWDHEFHKYADIDDILNVSRETSKHLITKMIANLVDCFSSNKIHLGMDEAYHLGRGTYLNEVGLKKSTEIMEDHLAFLVKVCMEYRVEPLMWDDMFFSNNPHKDKDNQTFKIPQNIDMVYWDYYHYDQAHYEKRMEASKALTGKVTFAGGFWRWLGYAPHYTKALQTTLPAIKAAKKQGVKEIFGTAWGDDGSEAPFDASLFGLVLYAYLNVTDTYDEKDFSEWLNFYTGMDYEAWMIQDDIDYLPGNDKSLFYDANPSKYLLYQDLLLPVFMPYIETLGKEYGDHLLNLKEKLCQVRGGNRAVNEFYIQFIDLLALKWDLPLKIYKAYHHQDKDELARIAQDDLPKLITLLADTLHARKKVWDLECKPFGFEILEHRFGGMMMRTQSTIDTLTRYVKGDIASIEELEEARLDPMGNKDATIEDLPLAVSYIKTERIMSRNRFSW